MSETTQEEALRLADELVGQALKETEARCSVLGQFINDCERADPSEDATATATEPDCPSVSATGSGSSAAAVMSHKR